MRNAGGIPRIVTMRAARVHPVLAPQQACMAEPHGLAGAESDGSCNSTLRMA
jgi:hypothetical protein